MPISRAPTAACKAAPAPVPNQVATIAALSVVLADPCHRFAASAAAEIHAQIVDQISRAALGKGLSGGLSVGSANVFEGGDFGTVPIGPKGPRPKVSILFGGNALSHVADVVAVPSNIG